jgi:hypothetical protein
MMLRRLPLFVSLSISFFLLSAHTAAGTGQPSLKLGDSLPPLAGQALAGKWLDVGSVAGSSPAVVVFSFSRAGGRDAQRWIERLTKDNPQLAIYTAIFLEAVPGLFRGMAVSGIKDGMPAALQGRTLLMYRDEDLWRQRLQVANERQACVVLLGPTGRIQWMGAGPFSEGLYSDFSKSIRGLK